MKFFENINTISELKKEYFKLAKIHHPDIGGDVKIMQLINNAYETMFNFLKSKIDYTNFTEGEIPKNYTYKAEESNDFMDIISKIIHIPNIVIEICGYWIWVNGSTKEYKKIFKDNGFWWSGNKFAWYWKPQGYKKKGRKVFTMEEIRDTFGSNIVKGVKQNKLKPSET